jgi:hypothetical protein
MSYQNYMKANLIELRRELNFTHTRACKFHSKTHSNDLIIIADG